MNDANGDTGAWYLLCTLSLASCRLRAESLARHLHNKLWTAGKFEAASMETGCSRRNEDGDGGDNSVLIVDRAPQPSTFKFYQNHHHFPNGHLWQNDLYVSEDEDDEYEPASDSQIGSSPSPPMPVDEDEEITVNPANGPGLIVSPKCAINRLALTSDQLSANQEVLYEKLMQFSDNNSLSDGDTSDTYYDVDSSSNSSCGEEGVTKDDLDMAAITKKMLPSDSSFDSGLNECFDSGVNCLNGEHDCTPLACSTPLTSSPSSPSPPLFIPNGSCVIDSFEAELINPPTEVTGTEPPKEFKEVEEQERPISPVISKFHVTPIAEQEQYNNTESSILEDETQKSQADEKREETENDTSVTSRTDWFFLDHPGLRETLKSTLAFGEKTNDIEDDDDESCSSSSGEMQRTRLLRSTSLKTGKTPPGTPRRKKIVRFADALGLDLEAVRHIVSDDLPNIPASAFTDLHIADTTTFNCKPTNTAVTAAPGISGKVLYPQFPQPVSDPCFMDRLRRQKVCLENVVVADLSLHCLIRVLNMSYEKMVVVRYTTNEWTSFQEVQGSYLQASSDGHTDKFCVNIYASHLAPGQRLLLAIKYVVGDQDYWDNNYGQNYVLRCHNTTSTTLGGGNEDASSSWYYHFM